MKKADAGRPGQGAVQRLVRPASVAIVGASPTRGALGASVLANLERFGYAGDIHLINPKRDRIGERACLKSIEDLPEGVDVAVLAIPRAGVVDALKALAARKVGGAIVFAAGFAEGGEQGKAEQREIGRIAAESGMVIEGPNCLGLVNFVDRIPLTFVEAPEAPAADRTGVGIVSQSGAMAIVLGVTLAAKGLGLTYSVSTGNEAASGVDDYVEFLIADERTRVIALIVEQFRQPKRFLELAEKARKAGKPVVLLHPGRSSAARESAATHTGAMAGDYNIMKTHVERAGVILAGSLEELGDIVDIVARCRSLPSIGPCVMTESGAFKAMTLDFCEDVGLDLPAVSDADAPELRAALPDFVPATNPIDLTAQALVDPDLYGRAIAALVGDKRFGAVVLTIIQTDDITCQIKFPPIIRAVKDLKPQKPVIFCGIDEGGVAPAGYVAQLRELGVPYFPTAERAYRALARVTAAARRDAASGKGKPVKLKGLPKKGVVPEYLSKALLGPAGLPFPRGGFAATLDEARAIAASIGYPVVIKAQSPDLSHKSDAGGVILNLGDAAALAQGWDRLYANVARYDAGIRLDGVLVEAMGKRGVELIVGAQNDPEWGPVILAGFGGVQAEILKDVRLFTPDLTTGAIVAELQKLKSAALLNGFRGSPALDVEAVAECISRLGRVMLAEPSIREIDLNPVVVYPRGEGVVALDALMLVGKATPSAH